MSQAEIPVLPGVPFQSVRVSLDGVSYTLDLRWNHRAAAFFLDLFDADRVPLMVGRRVVAGAMLTRQSHHVPGMPPGEILVFDTAARDVDPGLDDLGVRVQLIYLDRAELGAPPLLADAVR